jgi:putative transposase
MSPGRPPRLPGFTYLGPHRYSLCFVVSQRARLFVTPPLVHAVREQILRSAVDERFDVLAHCIMPDHVHILVEGRTESSDLRRFVKVVKQRAGYVARTTLGIPLTWQEGYYEHVLRSDESTKAVIRYILENPVRAGLVAHVNDYPFSGAMYWPEA